MTTRNKPRKDGSHSQTHDIDAANRIELGTLGLLVLLISGIVVSLSSYVNVARQSTPLKHYHQH